MGLNIGCGLRRLLDQQMRYVNAVHGPAYMRFRNFTPPQDQMYAQLGYTISPTGDVGTGTLDALIDPPPGSRLVSMHNIGMSAGKLRFGARDFVVSHSFVRSQQLALGLATPEQLWLSKMLVGIMAYGVLWSVELWASDDAGGTPIVWTVTCNANELR